MASVLFVPAPFPVTCRGSCPRVAHPSWSQPLPDLPRVIWHASPGLYRGSALFRDTCARGNWITYRWSGAHDTDTSLVAAREKMGIYDASRAVSGGVRASTETPGEFPIDETRFADAEGIKLYKTT